jgi:hypothetical protein
VRLTQNKKKKERNPPKLKIEVSYDSAIPILGIYPKKSKSAYYRES